MTSARAVAALLDDDLVDARARRARRARRRRPRGAPGALEAAVERRRQAGRRVRGRLQRRAAGARRAPRAQLPLPGGRGARAGHRRRPARLARRARSARCRSSAGFDLDGRPRLVARPATAGCNRPTGGAARAVGIDVAAAEPRGPTPPARPRRAGLVRRASTRRGGRSRSPAYELGAAGGRGSCTAAGRARRRPASRPRIGGRRRRRGGRRTDGAGSVGHADARAVRPAVVRLAALRRLPELAEVAEPVLVTACSIVLDARISSAGGRASPETVPTGRARRGERRGCERGP